MVGALTTAHLLTIENRRGHGNGAIPPPTIIVAWILTGVNPARAFWFSALFDIAGQDFFIGDTLSIVIVSSAALIRACLGVCCCIPHLSLNDCPLARYRRLDMLIGGLILPNMPRQGQTLSLTAVYQRFFLF